MLWGSLFGWRKFFGLSFFSLPIFGVKTYIRCVRDCHAELILEIEHSKIPTRESYHLVIIIPEDLELSELTIHYKNTLAQKADHFTPVQNRFRGTTKEVYDKKTYVVPYWVDSN